MNGPSTKVYSFKKMSFNKEIKYSVHSHPINRPGSFNDVENFCRGKWRVIAPDHFHDKQTVCSCFKAGGLQQLCVITLFTHILLYRYA